MNSLAELRAYVTLRDGEEYDGLPEGMIVVTFTHSNLQMQMKELRIQGDESISVLKEKLYTHCGTHPRDQQLQYKSEAGLVVLEDEANLGMYGVKNGENVHIVDTNPASLSKNGGLEDVSQIKKFELTEGEYDSRENTLRSYKKEQLKKDPKFQFYPNRGKPKRPIEEIVAECEELSKDMEVSQRCEVRPGGRRGEVAFKGLVEGLPAGIWIGVRFDEPTASGDGTRDGKRYFECESNYGAFVRPKNVEVGDFPELELTMSSDDEDEL